MKTPEERAEERRLRKVAQAERDAKALAHAKDHPLSEDEKARARRTTAWLNKHAPS